MKLIRLMLYLTKLSIRTIETKVWKMVGTRLINLL